MTQNATRTGLHKAIVFDCGGTLLHLDPSREVIFRDAAAELGLAIPLESIVRAYELADFALKMKSSELSSVEAKSRHYSTFNAALCSALGIEQSLQSLDTLLQQRFAQRCRWVPFPDAEETLAKLAARVPLYVLANWDFGLEKLMEQNRLRRFFQDVLSSQDLGAEKPARACYDEFLRRTALEAKNVIYVGDEYAVDVIGSRAMGLTPVLIDRDNRTPAADCVRVRALCELTDVLIPTAKNPVA